MSNDPLRKWALTALLLLLLFVLESSLVPWITPREWRTDLLIFPKLVLVCTVYIALLKNRHVGAAFALAFGLLQDVQFYGHMIGVNAFTFALSAYAAGLLVRPHRVSIVLVFLAQLSALLLYETSIYALYRLFSVTDADFGWMFVHGMLPSILVGLFFALALYMPVRKWFEPAGGKSDSAED